MGIHHHYGYLCLFGLALGKKERLQRPSEGGQGAMRCPCNHQLPLQDRARRCLGDQLCPPPQKPIRPVQKSISGEQLQCTGAPALVWGHCWRGLTWCGAVKGWVAPVDSTWRVLVLCMGNKAGVSCEKCMWLLVLHFMEPHHTLRKINWRWLPPKLP